MYGYNCICNLECINIRLSKPARNRSSSDLALKISLHFVDIELDIPDLSKIGVPLCINHTFMV